MLAEVCVQDSLDDHLAHLSLSLDGDVLKQVGVFHLLHYLKCSGQVMLFQDLVIRVSNGQGVLGPDNELIREPRVLKVVDQVREERSEHIR